MVKNDVTIFISSCDLYEDAWMPVIALLKKQWPECKYPIVLGTEEKLFDSPLENVQTICAGKNISWTERVRRCLSKIDTEYVLFMLEDYFLFDKVKVEGFEKALDIIRNDKTVGMIHFVPMELNMPTPQNDLGGLLRIAS